MTGQVNFNDLRDPLARARGLGSAKTGTHHWWLVKVTALALVPLTLFVLWQLLAMLAVGADYNEAVIWLKQPYVALPMLLLLVVNFYHAALAGPEIILDYVHHHRAVPLLIALYKGVCYAAMAAGLYAVVDVVFLS